MNTKLLLTSLFLIVLQATAGCECPPKEKPAAACGPSGEMTAKMDFPACNSITIEKTTPRQVIAGSDFKYTIKATNRNSSAANNVVLMETLPENVHFKSATPAPTSTGAGYTWNLGNMPGGSSKTIVVTATAVRTGDLVTCTDVNFKPDTLCMTVAAIEPRLEVTLAGPNDMVVCDPITYKIIVRNAGTGQACNVNVTDTLPAGMKALDGSTKISRNLGNLEPGQSREIVVDARAERTGRYVNRASASADGNLKASSAEIATNFRTPVLVVTKSGPDSEFIGKELTYSITVQNTGDAVSKNTVLTEQIHRGTQFKSASNGGKLSASYIMWELGDLQPGEKKTVSATVIPSEKGSITTMATAKAYCAENSASLTTMVRGIPAILLECVDLDDPIKIGNNTTYEIRVTNQGSEVGTNILIRCELPAELEFVSADGPVAGRAENHSVNFAQLSTLNPGATAIFKVMVKAVGPNEADVRFKVQLTSDQMTSPAGETESTHIY